MSEYGNVTFDVQCSIFVPVYFSHLIIKIIVNNMIQHLHYFYHLLSIKKIQRNKLQQCCCRIYRSDEVYKIVSVITF